MDCWQGMDGSRGSERRLIGVLEGGWWGEGDEKEEEDGEGGRRDVGIRGGEGKKLEMGIRIVWSFYKIIMISYDDQMISLHR